VPIDQKSRGSVQVPLFISAYGDIPERPPQMDICINTALYFNSARADIF